MNIFFATPEQMNFLEKLKVFETTVTHPKQFLDNQDLIDHAKVLLSKAHDLNMPLASYNNIRIVLNLYETEMSMPEHLRWFKSGV